MLLIVAIIVGLIGAAIVYFGRPRDRAFVFVGYLVLLAALVIFVVWLFRTLDDNGVNTALVLLR